jgi:nucleoside-diphosphate-sugar epimerase
MNWSAANIIVFGGNGFLGSNIIRQLIKLNCGHITAFNRSPAPELECLGVEVKRGDIRNASAVTEACRDATAVIHTSAKAGVWGSWHEYYSTNVEGTLNVLSGCRANRINRLVYTSSPSVAYPPTRDIVNIDESSPYPDSYLAYYPASKAIAEKNVLGAPDKELAAVVLRPHLLWGPGDPHLLPRIVCKAASGKLTRIGDGSNLVDLTYISNAASAHIKALEYLDKCTHPRRKVYFISDNSPVKIWDWLNELLAKLELPPVTRSISYQRAMKVGRAIELLYKVLPFLGEPPLTRFVAGQLAFSHYFNISAAINDLGYQPVIAPEKAMLDTVNWLKTEILQ